MVEVRACANSAGAKKIVEKKIRSSQFHRYIWELCLGSTNSDQLMVLQQKNARVSEQKHLSQ